jgi:hypothetical protein
MDSVSKRKNVLPAHSSAARNPIDPLAFSDTKAVCPIFSERTAFVLGLIAAHFGCGVGIDVAVAVG